MAAMSRSKRGYLSVLNNSLNRLTRRLARRGVGPFSLVRNVGRKSGTVYETPVILARVPEGFVAELTYGPDVQWYRNIVAAGRCEGVSSAPFRAHRRGNVGLVPQGRCQHRSGSPQTLASERIPWTPPT